MKSQRGNYSHQIWLSGTHLKIYVHLIAMITLYGLVAQLILAYLKFFTFMKTNFLGELTWQMHKIRKAARGKRFDILINKVEQKGIGGKTVTDLFMLNRKTFTKISLRFSIPFEKRTNQGLQQFNEEAPIEGEDFS